VTRPLKIPDSLNGASPLLEQTIRLSAETGHVWHDGRLWHWPPQAGAFYVRVSPRNRDFALRSLAGLVEACERSQLKVAPVGGAHGTRAGMGIGSKGNLATVELVELRGLAQASQADIDRWRYLNDPSYWDENTTSDPVHEIPRGNDKLRIILPRRPDWPHRFGPGWRRTFTGLVGEPFLGALSECLEALNARAKASRLS
jgi:hypothetical protein